ncbi:MAG: GNAT family N-acetyltransferase [Bacteroidales bacterium]
MELTWIKAKYSELTVAQLYDLLYLRNEVFIVEQRAAYLDLDRGDQISMHLMGYNGDTLVAYCRIFRTGDKYPDDGCIGRVVVNPNYRGLSIGDTLLEKAITLHNEFNGSGESIKISAQLHLRHFYEKHSFYKISTSYQEDNIPHIAMRRNAVIG